MAAFDLARPFLLSPMAAARKHNGLSQLRNELHKIGNELIHPTKTHYEVVIASQVKCGDRHACSSEWAQYLPVAIDVAVSIQTSAKPSANEFPRVEVHVGLCKPGRQGCGIHHATEETALARDHANITSRFTPLITRRIPRGLVEDLPHGEAKPRPGTGNRVGRRARCRSAA
jgi:hypothetical protein